MTGCAVNQLTYEPGRRVREENENSEQSAEQTDEVTITYGLSSYAGRSWKREKSEGPAALVGTRGRADAAAA